MWLPSEATQMTSSWSRNMSIGKQVRFPQNYDHVCLQSYIQLIHTWNSYVIRNNVHKTTSSPASSGPGSLLHVEEPCSHIDRLCSQKRTDTSSSWRSTVYSSISPLWPPQGFFKWLRMGELEWRGLEVIMTKTNHIEKEQYVNTIKQPNTSSKSCKKNTPWN